MVGVKEVRVLGGVGVIQLESPAAAAAITEAALHRGVWLRPFLDLVYTMPPYISTDEQLATIGSAMSGAIEEVVA